MPDTMTAEEAAAYHAAKRAEREQRLANGGHLTCPDCGAHCLSLLDGCARCAAAAPKPRRVTGLPTFDGLMAEFFGGGA